MKLLKLSNHWKFTEIYWNYQFHYFLNQFSSFPKFTIFESKFLLKFTEIIKNEKLTEIEILIKFTAFFVCLVTCTEIENST